MRNFSMNTCQLIWLSPLYSILWLNINLITHLETIIRPWTKFHFTTLIIEWKPGYIYFTCRFKDSRWYIQTWSVVFHYNICRIGTIKSFVSTEKDEKKINYLETYMVFLFWDFFSYKKNRPLIRHWLQWIFPEEDNKQWPN